MGDVTVLLATANANEPAHDEYGASSAERWTSCSASVSLCAKAPPGADSEYSEEGQRAHKHLEEALIAGKREVELDASEPLNMTRAINRCLYYVWEIIDANPGCIVSVECRVKVPSAVVPGRMGGTVDIRIYAPVAQWLWIIDYKHGVGIFVEAEDNLQMIVYAVASLWEIDAPVRGVSTAIVQPRSWVSGQAVRPYEYTIRELIKWHNWLDGRAAVTLRIDAPFAPSPTRCRYCTAGGYGLCPMLTRELAATFGVPTLRDVAFQGLPDPKTLSLEQMGYVLTNEDLFKAWFKNVRDAAEHLVKHGHEFPGFKMVAGQSRRAWYGDRAHIEAMLLLITGRPLDDIAPRELIGVTEAEGYIIDTFRYGLSSDRLPSETKKSHAKRLNAASQAAREAMALLTMKEPRGQPRLVPLSNPAPAIETMTPHFMGQLNLKGLDQ